MTDRTRCVLAGAYLFLCLLLGGASAGGAIANAFLQLLAILIVVLALWRSKAPYSNREASGLLWIVGLFVLLALASLVPLPASLWQQLPGREPIARGYAMLGIPGPWIPFSLDPDRTLWSLLSLLPPVAVFLLVVQLPPDKRRVLGWVVLGAAALSIFLAAFQLIGGPQSPLRFYEVTNPNRAVGFFAAANHFPTLVLCALPFVGMLAAKSAKSRNAQKKGGGLTISLSLGLFLAIGIAVSGSLAGYVLFLPTALGAFLVYRRTAIGRLSRGWAIGLAALSLLFILIASFGPLNQQALSDKFSEHPTSRGTIWNVTSEAIVNFLPWGSGLGTFGDVYRTFDDPDRAGNQFVNHAHNDYFEIALELGVPGLLLVACFLLWAFLRTARAWSEDFRGAALSRAGSIMIGVVLFHSITDYPLRTSAIATIFALACAFLVPPPVPMRREEDPAASESKGLRHLEVD